MIESHDYRLHLQATDGRAGELSAPEDGLPGLEVAPPPEFNGPEGIWSPEHLFVASVATCLMTTFQAIAAMSQLEVIGYSDEPSGHLVRGDDKRYRFESVTLRPRVLVADEGKVDRAHRLLQKAEEACLVSRSVNSEIHLEPTVEVATGS